MANFPSDNQSTDCSAIIERCLLLTSHFDANIIQFIDALKYILNCWCL